MIDEVTWVSILYLTSAHECLQLVLCSLSCDATILNWYSQGRASHTCIVVSTWCHRYMSTYEEIRLISFEVLWVTSCWWSQSSFVLTDLVSAVVNTWVFLGLTSSRMVITEGWTSLLCHLFNTELQMTTLRFTTGVHSLSLLRWCIRCCIHRVVEYSGFFGGSNSESSQKGRFLLESSVWAADDTQIHRHERSHY
jgi:hypothetical protein